MKKWQLILPCFFIIQSLSAQKNKCTVNGTFTQTSSYCSGAAPSPDLLDRLNTPRPLVGVKLYVRRGKNNNISEPVIAAVITDSLGQIKVNLAKGDYCLVSEKKKDKIYFNDLLKKYITDTKYYTRIDKECLNKWLKTPDVVFSVSDSHTTITHTYHFPCSWDAIPCASYTGPLPP